jgi:hypothetical protein
VRSNQPSGIAWPGLKEIYTYLFGDLLVVRLQGVLTAAERQLVHALPADQATGYILSPLRGLMVSRVQWSGFGFQGSEKGNCLWGDLGFFGVDGENIF